MHFKHLFHHAPAAQGTGVSNVGNIRAPDGHFYHYNSQDAGLNAMAGDLQAKFHVGMDTASSILTTYAPPSDHNDTPLYIKNVTESMSKELGRPIDGNTKLNLDDPKELAAMIKPMVRQENGDIIDHGKLRPRFSDEQLAQAADKAIAGGVSMRTAQLAAKLEMQLHPIHQHMVGLEAHPPHKVAQMHVQPPVVAQNNLPHDHGNRPPQRARD